MGLLDFYSADLDLEKHTEPRQLTVYIGAIEDASDIIKFTKHEWLSDAKDGGAADWIKSIDGEDLPRFACSHRTTKNEESTKLSPKEPTVENGRNSLELDAKCLCEGVQFKILRPKVKGTTEHTDNSAESPQRYIGNVCVCRDCRLSAGTICLTLAYVPIDNIRHALGEPFSMSSGTLKQ